MEYLECKIDFRNGTMVRWYYIDFVDFSIEVRVWLKDYENPVDWSKESGGLEGSGVRSLDYARDDKRGRSEWQRGRGLLLRSRF